MPKLVRVVSLFFSPFVWETNMLAFWRKLTTCFIRPEKTQGYSYIDLEFMTLMTFLMAENVHDV